MEYFVDGAFMSFRHMSLNPTATDYVDASIGADRIKNGAVKVKINASDRLSLIVKVKLLGCFFLCISENTELSSYLACN
jgi:hypothetical protein